jgi:transposase InsO family protein
MQKPIVFSSKSIPTYGPHQFHPKKAPNTFLVLQTQHLALSGSIVWEHYLKQKSNAPTVFKLWITAIKRQLNLKVGTICIDNSGEYTSKEFEVHLTQLGIHLETMSLYMPEQNGHSERQNCSIFDCIQMILIKLGLPHSL